MKKSKIGTVIIVLVTLLLAGVAIFTAIRLYQLRSVPVAPTAPTSKPKAQEVPAACAALAFNLAIPTSTATATATATSTATATATATSTASSTTAPTTTPTKTASSAASTSPTEASLPNSGTSWPTVVGMGLGILVIIGSLLLAL